MTTVQVVSQPFLHDLVCAVRAPALAVSGADGQIRGEGVHGIYVADRRIVSRAVLTLDGAEPTPLAGHPVGGDLAWFVATVRTLGDQYADPTVLVRRERTTVPDGAVEQVEVVSYARETVRTTLSLEMACDLAEMALVRSGGTASTLSPASETNGLCWHGDDGTIVHVLTDRPPDPAHAEPGRLDWAIELAPRAAVRVRLTYLIDDDRPPIVAAAPVA